MTANRVVLRIAETKDVPFLADVVLRTSRERQVKDIPDLAAFRQGLVEDAIEQVEREVAGSTTYVIERGNQPVGRLRVVRTGEAIEVAGLQIVPPAQGAGIGSEVLRNIQAEAAGAGLPVVLEVGHDNPDAARLYVRLGFRACGTAHWPNRSRLEWTSAS